MAGFPMCERCQREYHDPADRRFHAQPIACHDCGPTLRFTRDGNTVTGADEAIAAAQRVLAEGGIVAVKGIGGYHLACRADCPETVTMLRQRKARGDKPFAVLTRNLSTARLLAEIGNGEQRSLTGSARPIVLLRRLPGAPVADTVAPGNPLLGVLLPYTPVHHLLLAPVPDSTQPVPHTLVLTSANISDEPLVFDDAEADVRLTFLADAVLTHDRPIHVPCDDSVVRVLPEGELPIRRARGYAPLPVPLGRALPSVLAVGGELKNSCCLTDGDSAFCSAHIGDMGNLATLRAFDRVVTQLTTVHRVTPEVIAADLHPAYQTGEWAHQHAGGPGEPALRLVQHHHAHVASLLAEHGRLGEPMIGVAFDGTGYGTDGTIWGGEILHVGARPHPVRRASATCCRSRWPAATPPSGARAGSRSATWPPPGSPGIPRCRRWPPAPTPSARRWPPCTRGPGRGRAAGPGRATPGHATWCRAAAWAGFSTRSPRCSGSGTGSVTRPRPRSSLRTSPRRPPTRRRELRDRGRPS